MMTRLCPEFIRWSLLGLMSAAVCGQGQTQTDPSASSPVMGFRRIQLAEGWHAVGPPFEPFAVAHGSVTGLQKSQVTFQSRTQAAAWPENQWQGYELCVTTGTASGRRYAITANSATGLVLDGDPAGDGLALGDTVTILPSIEEYLGGQLIGGDTAAGSDWVGTFYQNTLIRLHRNKDGQWLNDAGRPVRLSIVCGGGFLINLTFVNGQPRPLLLTGQWNGDQGGGFINAGQQIISVPLTVAPQTVGSVLGATGQGRGPTAGATFEESDQVNVLNEQTGEFRACWLDAIQGQWRWRDSSDPAGGFILEPGRGYLFNHLGDGFYWQWR